MLNITRHDSIRALKKRMRLKENAEVRDRAHAVVLAFKGKGIREISERLDYSVAWVTKWVYRYRDLGWGGLWDRPRSGQPKRLSASQEKELGKLIEKGAKLEEDGVTRFRAKDLRELIRKRFGAQFSLSGVKALVKRMGFSSIKPRPRHPKNDHDKMKVWKTKTAPLAISQAKKNTRTRRSKSGSKMKAGMVRKGSSRRSGQGQGRGRSKSGRTGSSAVT